MAQGPTLRTTRSGKEIKMDKKSLSKENSHKFAKELLKRIYGGKYKKLKVDDKPDLKNLKQGFGVEVTRAVNGKKLTMLKEFLFGSLKDEELFTYKEKMLQEFEKETFDEKLKQIKKIYDQKIGKLNNGNYDCTPNCDLLIYTSLKGKVNLKEIQKLFKTPKRNYNKIYLVAYDNLYEFDLKNKTYKTINYQTPKTNHKEKAFKKVKFYWL